MNTEHTHYNLHRNNGFTLVELIIVLVILGALAAIASPSWKGLGSYADRGFFDSAIQAARYAQKYAVVSNCDVVFTLSSQGFSLTHNGLPNTHDHCASTHGTVINIPGNTGTAHPSRELSITISTVTFHPSGKASELMDISIGSDAMRIYPSTGYVERL